MGNEDERFADLADWLQERGHTALEIDKILKRVREYDEKTSLDSVMDSIDRGDFNIAGIIKEALGESE